MPTPTCDYVKPNGEFCGSMALHGRAYCHWHLTCVGRRVKADKQEVTLDYMAAPLDLPPLEDANSIQVAIMQVMDALMRQRIGPKISGQLLYALQIASSNLKLGVNFKPGVTAQTEDSQPKEEAIVCTAYESFEEDYNIVERSEELRTTSPEAQPVATAGANASGNVEDEPEHPDATNDEGAVPNREADVADDEAAANGRAAGRQKVLFGVRKPPEKIYGEWYSQRHRNTSLAMDKTTTKL